MTVSTIRPDRRAGHAPGADRRLGASPDHELRKPAEAPPAPDRRESLLLESGPAAGASDRCGGLMCLPAPDPEVGAAAGVARSLGMGGDDHPRHAHPHRAVPGLVPPVCVAGGRGTRSLDAEPAARSLDPPGLRPARWRPWLPGWRESPAEPDSSSNSPVYWSWRQR